MKIIFNLSNWKVEIISTNIFNYICVHNCVLCGRRCVDARILFFSLFELLLSQVYGKLRIYIYSWLAAFLLQILLTLLHYFILSYHLKLENLRAGMDPKRGKGSVDLLKFFSYFLYIYKTYIF